MASRLAPAVLLAALLAACGGEQEGGKAWVDVPGAPWARMTREQVDAAKAMGVPPTLELDGVRFVFIPAGTFPRQVDGSSYEVNLGVGFYIQPAPLRLGDLAGAEDDDTVPPNVRALAMPLTHRAAEAIARGMSAGEAAWQCRLPTEAEWEYARRFLFEQPDLREWMLDRHGPLPTWTVSDPHGPREGAAYVARRGSRREAVAPDEALAFRLVIPLGYGLGAYGATKVTFRLIDDEVEGHPVPVPGGYDLRIISMNDRLQARTLGVETDWQRVPDPGSPWTTTMVPGAYYVYAERMVGGKPLRGREMKFYVSSDPVDRPVPIPEKDQKRYGSGGREKPQ